MADVVLLFAGQGAQRVGMGQDLAGKYPLARKRFEEGARKHRGQVAGQTGDAFLLTFPSALDAVQAALTIHRRHRNRLNS